MIRLAMLMFLVTGFMRWGEARMEAALHSYIDRIGWTTVILVMAGIALYRTGSA
jgi:di/tricarboxylate transporter